MGILSILNPLGSLVTGWLQGHQKLKQTKLEGQVRIEVARAEAEVTRLQKAQDAEVAWDNTVAAQMEHSWKDEWFTILLTIPVILAFCGHWGRDRAAEGFQALSTMPQWYMVSFLSAIAASFGIRALVNKFGFGNIIK